MICEVWRCLLQYCLVFIFILPPVTDVLCVLSAHVVCGCVYVCMYVYRTCVVCTCGVCGV